MFRGQREFRAIAVVPKGFTDVAQVLQSLDDAKIIDSMEPVPCDGAEVFHATYWSSRLFCSQGYFLDEHGELKKDVTKQVRNRIQYRYNLYACLWKRRNQRVFIVAVPFSAMAAHVFGVLDEATRNEGRKYKKIDLVSLVERASSQEAGAIDLTVSALRVRVGGADSVKTVRFSGPDVLRSETYNRMVDATEGIAFRPRRARVYLKGADRFAAEIDGHGNLWFPVSRMERIARLFPLVSTLDNCSLIMDTNAYPMRVGIREEEEESIDGC